MDIFGIRVDEIIAPGKHMLGALTQTQQATSNNIANVNTPGYKAQHPDFVSLIEQGNSPFETKLSMNMGPSQAPSLFMPDTGKVDLQMEIMAAQDNLMRFGIVTQHLTKVFTRLKEANNIGR